MNEKAGYYIEKLQLKKHPEGGYFNEIYRSGEIFEADILPGRYSGNRSFSTSIYFLLSGRDKSKLHKLKSDEIWHFYDGCPVRIYVISEEGNLEISTLGDKLDSGEVLQTVIKKDHWFGAELTEENSFGLVGCTVAPGFDFDDFEMANRANLLEQFPQHKNIIINLTNPG